MGFVWSSRLVRRQGSEPGGLPRGTKPRVSPRTPFSRQNVIAEHEIRNISCAAQDPEDLCTFAYITKDLQTSHHYCHVFSTVDVVSVPGTGAALAWRDSSGQHRPFHSRVAAYHDALRPVLPGFLAMRFLGGAGPLSPLGCLLTLFPGREPCTLASALLAPSHTAGSRQCPAPRGLLHTGLQGVHQPWTLQGTTCPAWPLAASSRSRHAALKITRVTQLSPPFT